MLKKISFNLDEAKVNNSEHNTAKSEPDLIEVNLSDIEQNQENLNEIKQSNSVKNSPQNQEELNNVKLEQVFWDKLEAKYKIV